MNPSLSTALCLVVCLLVAANAGASPFMISTEYASPANATAASDNFIPTVLMHGMGDSAHFPGMKSLASSIMKKYPGSYAVAADVSNGLTSYYHKMDVQLTEFQAFVNADPKLKNGFNLVGFSQGGLLAKAYATKRKASDPPVFNLVSVCGTLNGIATCPTGLPSGICAIYNKLAYKSPLVFASYWKDVSDEPKYLSENTFLPDLLNEGMTKNADYVKSLSSVSKFVMVMALNDTMVVPKESEQMGFFAWGDTARTTPILFRDTDGYKADWAGLQAMDKAGKIDLLEYEGDHLRFSNAFWNDSILPYFGNQFSN